MDSPDVTHEALIAAALADDGPWRTFMDAAPYAMSMIDLSGRQRWSNHAWRALFGGSVSGMTAVDYTAAADRILTDDYLRRHGTGEIDPITVRKRYRRHDGSEFDADLHSFLLRDRAGGLTLRSRPFDLHQLLRAEVELAATAREHTLFVDVTIEDAVPTMVAGDPDRVRQILRNVIGNAVKYTERGRVLIRARADGEVVEFDITDTGIGIDDATLRRLFEPFVRGDQAAQNHQGAGLGLAIVRELIDRMGGTIDVSSRHGEGSRFVIRLPIPAVDHRPTTVVPDVEADLGGMRVLIVDDDPVNRMLGEAQCTRLGATCDSACDGVDALRVLANGSFDVVLVDMQMPNMGGLELARIVSAQRQHPYLIGMTASAAAADRDACLAAGMQSFLTKPASLAAITEALHAARRGVNLQR